MTDLQDKVLYNTIEFTDVYECFEVNDVLLMSALFSIDVSVKKRDKTGYSC